MSSERSGESHLSADTNSQPSASTDAPSKTVEESISLSIVSVPSSLRPTPHLAREKGQILPRRGGFDSEDAEEYTERRVATDGGGKKSSHLSESEDAEESRHDVRAVAEMMHDTSEAEEYSYMGGGGGWSRSESGRVASSKISGYVRHSSLSKASEQDDGISEEVSVSESLVIEKKGEPVRKQKYTNKSYEESTDAESASESEVPLKE